MRRLALLCSVALVALVGGCPDKSGRDNGAKKAAAPRATPNPTPWLFLETGDLDALKKRHKLRVLLPQQTEAAYLPRSGFPLDVEREAAEELAGTLGLDPVFVYVEKRGDLLPWLLEGKGDIVAANLTVTDERKKQVAFTVPLARVHEQVVVRKDDPIKSPADLAGRKVIVRRSSSFWGTIEALQKKYPTIELVPAPDHLDTEQIIHGVAKGEYDVTVSDNNLIEAVLSYRQDVKVAFDVSDDRPIAWALRPESTQLKAAADKYLNEAQLARRKQRLYAEDLPGLKKRKTLRVITRNSAATYFLHKGELLGFEFELARKFAESQGLRLQIVVPPTRDDLFKWLRDGRGDIVAAALTVTEKRGQDPSIAWSRPYSYASELVVTRTGDKIESIEDLAGRKIVVRKSSSYWETLEKLKAGGAKFELEAAPEDMETEEIIGKVAAGEYDVTVADSDIVDIELTYRTDVESAFPLGEPVARGWAMRAADAELKKAVDAFIKKEYRGLFYNLTYQKYFKNERNIRAQSTDRADKGGTLSPYDDIVQTYAQQYGFDWRLIVSQMYQESRFDPEATSWVGAKGLMQVMPRTAKELGFDDIVAPEPGIHAGIKYMNWVRDRFEPDLGVRDRAWFALAAYNAGYGHVLDARRLAEQKGWDPDRWFDNTERAMLLLSRPEYARHARYGYCRGVEPVKYVKEIRDRYDAYVRVTDEAKGEGA